MRSRLISLVLAAVAVLTFASPRVFADEQRQGTLVGTWMFKVSFTGIPDFRYLQTFNADGVSTLILPDPGPGFTDGRSACVGEWKAAGHRTFDVVTWCLESQELNGWLDKIRSHLKLSEGGRRLSDPKFSAEWWLGDTYSGIGYGSMEGVRISGGKH
jgi:hypothetical protein